MQRGRLEQCEVIFASVLSRKNAQASGRRFSTAARSAVSTLCAASSCIPRSRSEYTSSVKPTFEWPRRSEIDFGLIPARANRLPRRSQREASHQVHLCQRHPGDRWPRRRCILRVAATCCGGGTSAGSTSGGLRRARVRVAYGQFACPLQGPCARAVRSTKKAPSSPRSIPRAAKPRGGPNGTN